MINIDYINDSIGHESNINSNPFNLFLESCENDINMMFTDFSIFEEKVLLESEIMGSIPESMSVVYESEKKSIFAKIGEMIVVIYNKFVEFIDSIIDKIRTLAFRKKSDVQKLEVLLKHHPDLKNEAVAAFNSGALDLSDVRSLKELDSAFEEILKMAKKKDIDPKSLRGRWEKAKEKFEADEKSWKLVKLAAATTTVVSAAVAVKTFGEKCAKATNNSQKEKQIMREKKAEILSYLKDEGAITDDTGKCQTLLQIWRELNGCHSSARNEELSVINKLANGIAAFVDKVDPESGKKLHKDLAKTKELADARKTK